MKGLFKFKILSLVKADIADSPPDCLVEFLNSTIAIVNNPASRANFFCTLFLGMNLVSCHS